MTEAPPVANERSVYITVGIGNSLRYKLIYVTDEQALTDMMTWLHKLKAVGLDLETSAIKPYEGKIATLQLGYPFGDDPKAYVIDVRCFTPDQLEPVFKVLEDRNVIKVGANLKFECQWLQHQFGVRVRGLQDTQVTEQIIRTGLFLAKNKGGKGERAAYKWCSMARLCWHYLKQDIDKDHDLRTSFYSTPAGKHNERQLAYAAGDVIYPFYILKHQWPIAKARGLTNILKIEYAVIPVLAQAEIKGLLIDTAAWKALWQESVTKVDAVCKTLDDMFRPITLQSDLFRAAEHVRPIYPKKNVPLNYASSEHKLWAIKEYCKSIGWSHEIITDEKAAEKLKLEHGKQWLANATKNGRVVENKHIPDSLVPEDQYCLLLDTDRKTLELRALRGQLPRPLVELLGEYSMHEKRITAFGVKFLNKYVSPDDRRLRGEFHQAVTDTGRLSSQPNSMNWPKDPRYRKCLIAPKGYKFVILDASQIEPRISAQVSKDPTYTEAFLTGDDIYLRVAENMFGFRPDVSTEEGEMLRHIAKIIVLALAYRMGPEKLRNQLTLGLAQYIKEGKRKPPTIAEARDLWDKFFQACPGLKEYQELCSTLADPKATTRPKIWDDFLGADVTYIQAPCGRIRFFPPDATDTFTTAANAPIQGTGSTMLKLAAVMAQDYFDEHKLDAYAVNFIHDEIVWAVREADAQAFAHKAKEIMELAGARFVPDIPILAEFPKNTTGVLDFWAKKAELEEHEEEE